MFLAIDIGNSNIVLGLFSDNKLLYQYRIKSDSSKTIESYSLDLVELFLNSGIDCLKISNIAVASVVPDLTDILNQAFARFCNAQFIDFSKNINSLNVKIDLKSEEEVGIDRLVNAKIAFEKFGADLIVVDFGTATTFDVVGDKGQYLGGVIAPGVNLSIKALHENTAKLPNINLKRQDNVIGKNTKEAMNSGIYFGYISLIEGLILRIKEEYQKDMKVILTGGLSKLFSKELKNINHIEPDLTIYGIKLIFDNYFKKSVDLKTINITN